MGFHSTLALVFSFAFAILLLCISGLTSVCSVIVSFTAASLHATSAYAIALLQGAQNELPMLAGALFFFFSWPFGLSLCWELQPEVLFLAWACGGHYQCFSVRFRLPICCGQYQC